MAIFKQKKMPIDSEKYAQIRALLFDKISIAILAEYFNYRNVFSAENIAKLPEHIQINEYIIKLKKKNSFLLN